MVRSSTSTVTPLSAIPETETHRKSPSLTNIPLKSGKLVPWLHKGFGVLDVSACKQSDICEHFLGRLEGRVLRAHLAREILACDSFSPKAKLDAFCNRSHPSQSLFLHKSGCFYDQVGALRWIGSVALNCWWWLDFKFLITRPGWRWSELSPARLQVLSTQKQYSFNCVCLALSFI
jgi:hypothetical protein